MPKDPELAVRAFAALARDEAAEPWTLEVIGSGTLRPALEARIAALPPDVSRGSPCGAASPRWTSPRHGAAPRCSS